MNNPKKLFSLTGLLGSLLLAAPPAHAQFTYTTNFGGVSISITGYTGPPWAVTIPTNINGLTVTRISGYALAGHTDLTSVTIPGSVTSIGDGAFYDCTGLTSVTIPGSVSDIGDNAFQRCTDLTSVAIPGSVSNIGDYAFQGCTKLTNTTMSIGVASIGAGAFFGCTGLTDVTIPGSVTNIRTASFGNEAAPFGNCTSLRAITVETNNSFYSSRNGVLFDKSQTTLIDFPGAVGGAYTIPDSVTSIGGDAFYGCTSLTDVTIPGSVSNIGDYAFQGCTNLTRVYCQGNAPTLGSDGFSDPSLNNVTVYYLPGTTGWSATFGGLRTALWSLPNPVILNNRSSLGVKSNAFGFIISWATNVSVVVEVSTNLANPIWLPVATNTLTNGSSHFSEPLQTNSSGRYYRISSP